MIELARRLCGSVNINHVLRVFQRATPKRFIQVLVAAVCTMAVPVSGADHTLLAIGENTLRTLDCSETIKPNRLVVSGGISASSVRPKQGSDQIDQQMAIIRTYVKSKDGLLHERERLRAARNPESSSDGVAKLPFIQVQRIEAEFPLGVDVDEILERMLKLGMDRYGKDAAIEGYATREYKVLTSYRFTNIDELLRGILARCIRDAAKRHCGDEGADKCVPRVVVYSSSAQTEPVAGRDGYKRNLSLFVSSGSEQQSAQTEPLDLLSDKPFLVRLTTNVRMPTSPLADRK